MTSVTMLGTGIMGAAMARNLAGAGLKVTAWNRTRDRALPLEGDGVTVAADPAEAVAGADVVITMLSDGRAVEEAVTAAAEGLRAGQIWAQMSTVGVAATDRLAALAREHGLVYVDAPVQGTRQPAEQGKLVVLAAGPQEARETLAPVFDAVGSRTLWVGEAGAATRLKLATVAFGISLTAALGEALALAKALGLDPALFGEVVGGGPMDSPYVQAKMKAILGGDYEPSFTVANAEKDTRLIAEAAEGAGIRADVAVAAGERFRRAMARGHGDKDMAAGHLADLG
ncbi:NAD(P)-dependent oxidoreductase [Thermoactinospora rubra]|uniref:NAD(P)-dependent oxidoreductase n=1 Tax=Thermoactinospora rubra TaxID=1088767 RepID=UPI000A1013F1|nr:NAD(P)-dependent oxidoreductase [Thermoactinospora rubra]